MFLSGYSFMFISGLLIALTGLFIASILLGAFAYGKKHSTQILGVLLALSMSSWGAGAMWLGTSLTAQEAVIAGRVMHLGIIFIPAFFIHFAIAITENKRNWTKYIIYGYYFLAIFLVFIDIYTPYFVKEVQFLFNEFYYNSHPTPYYIVFITSYTSSMILGLYLLYKKGKETGGNPYKILLLGLGISWFGGSTVLLPVMGIMLYPYGNLLIPIYPMAIAYAILKHRMFDARYAVLQVARIITIIGISLTIGYLLYHISIDTFGYMPQFHPVETGIGIICALFVLFFYRSQRLSNFFLISSLATLEREIEAFIQRKGVYKNVAELQSDLEGLFYRGTKIQTVRLVGDISVLNYSHIIRYFEKYRKPLILGELENEEVEGESSILIKEVRELGEAIFPIENTGGKGFFFLILGKKESEEQLTEKEVRIINRILPKVALAFQILEFNQSLQDEVKRQTKILNKKNEELQVANEKLKEVDRNKDNFLAIASHELRSPMTVIKGYSDLFLQDEFGPMTEAAKSHMKKIYGSTIQLIDLVNNILDISKIEAGRLEVEYKDISIANTLSSRIDNFSTLYREKGIELTLTNRCTIDTMHTDESKFIILCNNLLTNAYKFTERGGVHMEAWNSEDNLFVSVTDTGKGIEKERLPHIFEKFTQTDSSSYTKKSIRGSGLGLYLCHLLIGLIGGTITAQSTQNVGSTFTFSLPLHAPHIQ